MRLTFALYTFLSTSIAVWLRASLGFTALLDGAAAAEDDFSFAASAYESPPEPTDSDGRGASEEVVVVELDAGAEEEEDVLAWRRTLAMIYDARME